MNLQKNGNFIAEMRKKQNLTPEYLGSNLAVSLLTMGYGILGKIICLILKEKIEYKES